MAISDDTITYLMGKGRRPSFDSRGNVRGFRSAPGAKKSDPASNLGASNGISLSGTPDAVWNQIFSRKNTQDTGAPMDTAVDQAIQSIYGGPGVAPARQPSAPPSYNGSYWGSNAASAREWPQAPYMPQPPQRQFVVPNPATSPTGTASTDAVALRSNFRQYQPGGMTTGFWGGTSNAPGLRPAELAQWSFNGRTNSVISRYGWGSAYNL